MTNETTRTQNADDVTEAADQGILAGQITGAHGVSGNVRVRLIGANSEVSASALKNATTISLVRDTPPLTRQLTLGSLRKQAQAKGAWIASFKEVSDRNQAEELYGASLYVPETCLPKLPEGEYYVDQLIGLSLVTEAGKPLGELVDVMHTPANDVYVTSSGTMVPAVAAFIQSIDLSAGKIVVADVPGLLDT